MISQANNHLKSTESQGLLAANYLNSEFLIMFPNSHDEIHTCFGTADVLDRMTTKFHIYLNLLPAVSQEE